MVSMPNRPKEPAMYQANFQLRAACDFLRQQANDNQQTAVCGGKDSLMLRLGGAWQLRFPSSRSLTSKWRREMNESQTCDWWKRLEAAEEELFWIPFCLGCFALMSDGKLYLPRLMWLTFHIKGRYWDFNGRTVMPEVALEPRHHQSSTLFSSRRYYILSHLFGWCEKERYQVCTCCYFFRKAWLVQLRLLMSEERRILVEALCYSSYHPRVKRTYCCRDNLKWDEEMALTHGGKLRVEANLFLRNLSLPTLGNVQCSFRIRRM